MTGKSTLVTDSVSEAAKKLAKGELDAAFFVRPRLRRTSIRNLMNNPKVHLLSLHQHVGYPSTQHRFLSESRCKLTCLFNLAKMFAERGHIAVARYGHARRAQGRPSPPLTSLLLERGHSGTAGQRRRVLQARRVPVRLLYRSAAERKRQAVLQVGPDALKNLPPPDRLELSGRQTHRWHRPARQRHARHRRRAAEEPTGSGARRPWSWTSWATLPRS